jgi:hypothetical protein
VPHSCALSAHEWVHSRKARTVFSTNQQNRHLAGAVILTLSEAEGEESLYFLLLQL